MVDGIEAENVAESKRVEVWQGRVEERENVEAVVEREGGGWGCRREGESVEDAEDGERG